MGKLSKKNRTPKKTQLTPVHDENGNHWNNGFAFKCNTCKEERHLADLVSVMSFENSYREDVSVESYRKVCKLCYPKFMAENPNCKPMKGQEILENNLL